MHSYISVYTHASVYAPISCACLHIHHRVCAHMHRLVFAHKPHACTCTDALCNLCLPTDHMNVSAQPPPTHTPYAHCIWVHMHLMYMLHRLTHTLTHTCTPTHLIHNFIYKLMHTFTHMYTYPTPPSHTHGLTMPLTEAYTLTHIHTNHCTHSRSRRHSYPFLNLHTRTPALTHNHTDTVSHRETRQTKHARVDLRGGRI
jgi:hypothetical protein